jgi:hypothetical protein
MIGLKFRHEILLLELILNVQQMKTACHSGLGKTGRFMRQP